MRPAAGGTGLLFKRGSDGGGQQWVLETRRGPTGQAESWYRMCNSGGYCGEHMITGVTVLQVGQWYHVVAVWEPSGSTLYVNGALDAAFTFNPEGWALRPNQQPSSLGAWYAAGGVSDYLDGDLDEVAIYPQALSATQIATHYQAAQAALATPMPTATTPPAETPTPTATATATPTPTVTLTPLPSGGLPAGCFWLSATEVGCDHDVNAAVQPIVAPAVDVRQCPTVGSGFPWPLLYHYDCGPVLGAQATATAQAQATATPTATATPGGLPPTGDIAVFGATFSRGAYRISNTFQTLLLPALGHGGRSVVQMQISGNGINTRLIGYSGLYSWTVPPPDGPKTVTVQYYDDAGNPSTIYTWTGILDTSGQLINNTLRQLTPGEQAVADLLVNEGDTVEVLAEDNPPNTPNPDFRVTEPSGQVKITEVKTVSNIQNTSEDGLSSAISSTIYDASGQAPNVIIDARDQAGMTSAAADRAIRRAFGADLVTQRIQEIRIIGPDFDMIVPRI